MRKLLVLLTVGMMLTGCCCMKKMCPAGSDKSCCMKKTDDAKMAK